MSEEKILWDDMIDSAESGSDLKDFPRIAMKYFIDKGLQPHQAAGIVGNLMHESEGGKPFVEERSGGGGYGLAQWTGPRRTALKNWAAKQGRPLADVNTQLDFLWNEFTSPDYQRAYHTVTNAPDIQTATEGFSKHFEKPGKVMMGSRLKFANQALQGLGVDTSNMFAGPGATPGVRDTSPEKQAAIEKAMPEDIKFDDEDVKWDEPQGTSGIGSYPQNARVMDLLGTLKSLEQYQVKKPTISWLLDRQFEKSNPVAELGRKLIGGDVATSPSGITAFDVISNMASTGTEPLKPLVRPMAQGLDWIQNKIVTPAAEAVTRGLPRTVSMPGGPDLAAGLGTPVEGTPTDFVMSKAEELRKRGEEFPLRSAAELAAELAAWSAVGGGVKWAGGKLGRGARWLGGKGKELIDFEKGFEAVPKMTEADLATARQTLIDMVPEAELTQPTAEELTANLLSRRAIDRQNRINTYLGTESPELPQQWINRPRIKATEPAPILDVGQATKEDIIRGYAERSVPETPYVTSTKAETLFTPETKLTGLDAEKTALFFKKHQVDMNRIINEGRAGFLEKQQLKEFYGGGTKLYGGIPIDAFIDEQILKKGMSPAMAIAMAAKKYGKTPKDVMAVLAAKPPIALNTAATVTKDMALDSFHEPFIPAKNAIQELGDKISDITTVGALRPEMPKTPTKIDPVAPEPLRDLTKLERTANSPTVWDNGLWPGMKGIIADYYQSLNDYLFKSAYYNKWLDTAFKPFMANVKASVKDGEKLLGPLWTRYVKLVKPAIKAQGEIAALEEQLANIATDSPKRLSIQAAIDNKKAFIDSVYTANKQAIEDIMTSRQSAIKFLAEKHPNVRMKLAADGEEWAAKLLSPEEAQVVGSMRGVLDDYKTRMTERGMPVIKENYTPYVWSHGTYSADPMIDRGLNYYVQQMFPYKAENPIRMAKFLSRTPGSKDWFPYAYQTMKPYIGTVERKLAFNPMHEKWAPAFKGWQESGDFQNLSHAVKSFYDKMFSYEGMKWNENVINKMVNYTYFAQLWGNLRSALLHLGKLRFTPTEHGFGATAKGISDYGKALFGKGSPEQKVMNFYLRQSQIIRSIEQDPAWSNLLGDEFWVKLRNSGNLTRFTEHLDRGINMFATMARGERLQKDVDTIHRAIIHYQNMLNFQATDMPSFMRGPVGRAFTMYAGQPYKGWEYQLGVARKALTATPDIFGDTKNFQKFLRMTAIMGTMLGAGAFAGLDLSRHVLHVPFTSETKTGDPGLATPPWMNVLKAGNEVGYRGIIDETARSVMPFQSIINDIKYASGNIPKKFDDNIVAALLGIPTEEGMERQHQAQIKAAKRDAWKLKQGVTQQALDYWEGK